MEPISTDLLVAGIGSLIVIVLIVWVIWEGRDFISGKKQVALPAQEAQTGKTIQPLPLFGSIILIFVGCVGGWFVWHIDGPSDSQFGIWPVVALFGLWGLYRAITNKV